MRILALSLVVGSAVAVAIALGNHAAAQSSVYGDANAAPAPFNPQMAAMMSMIIQPRHAKLGLAGKAENWPLAAYALKELKQGFVITARAVPRWKGLPVPELFDASVDHPLRQVDVAIKLKNKRLFEDDYGRLTNGCNACHATTDHAFIVIKPPIASAFPNQEFEVKR
jgi:hypothetical protein